METDRKRRVLIMIGATVGMEVAAQMLRQAQKYGEIRHIDNIRQNPNNPDDLYIHHVPENTDIPQMHRVAKPIARNPAGGGFAGLPRDRKARLKMLRG